MALDLCQPCLRYRYLRLTRAGWYASVTVNNGSVTGLVYCDCSATTLISHCRCKAAKAQGASSMEPRCNLVDEAGNSPLLSVPCCRPPRSSSAAGVALPQALRCLGPRQRDSLGRGEVQKCDTLF